MFKNIFAVAFILIFLVELYFLTAGSAHRRKKKLKGWNPVKGRIDSIEKIHDDFARKTLMELTITAESGHTAYYKMSPMFCIYDVGEEVELIEKDGVHRFIGNERVHRKGVKETLLGTIPFLALILIAAIISYLTNAWS